MSTAINGGETPLITEDFGRDDDDSYDHPVDALLSFERLQLQKDDFVISDAVFDFKTAPGHMEEAYVGSHEWLTTWFPYNRQHITISFNANGVKCRFSIPEAILVKSCEYFQTALRSGRWKECAVREFALVRSEAVAVSTIVVFLLTGTFPQHPKKDVQTTSQMIDDLISGYYMSDYLGLRCMERFNRSVCLRLRQLLLAERRALLPAHLGKLVNYTNERINGQGYYAELWDVFAHAAVKPWMQSWMAKSIKSSASTVSCSVAFDVQYCGRDAKAWAEVVAHYISLMNKNNTFAVRVMHQVQKTMENAKRLNRFAPAQDGSNKKIHKMPDFVDYVTYRDPLPEGKTQIFTI